MKVCGLFNKNISSAEKKWIRRKKAKKNKEDRQQRKKRATRRKKIDNDGKRGQKGDGR